MTRRIVEQFDPDRIIIFGSHARGTAGPESDVDLLVVLPILEPVSMSDAEDAVRIAVCVERHVPALLE
ncbi:MAG: hypothetical protein CME06_05755 [Gemmatimonadetes bacterium]|nr:hypothetical protein [Gemmatimonadota bacterium]